MKTLLFCLFVSFCSMAHATTIYVESNAGTTTNNSGDPTVVLDPNPAWAPALPGSEWISYGSTGDPEDVGFFSPPNGTIVTFTTQFHLSGAITGGYLEVLADDTTSVILNGYTLLAADKTKGPTCAAGVVGCLTSTEGVFTFAQLAPYLIDGTNTLSFGVEQMNGSSFGLDFEGGIEDGTETPEPVTFACIGAGLVTLAALRRRK